MDDTEPGPSRRQVRRNTKGTPRDIAEIYAKITAMDVKTTAMAEASAIRFGKMQQDIDRLQSNSETQRKYIGQVELRMQSAVDQAQQQIDSLRQQTSDMHTSLGAIHQHLEVLTEGLKTMINRFSNLQFDLSNTFDNWMRVRMAQEGAGSGTVSGADLHQGAWSSTAGQTPIPSVPSLMPLHRTPSAPSPVTPSAPTTGPSSEPSLRPPSRSPTHSPTDLYQQFMVKQKSDAILDLRKDLDGDEGGDMDVDGAGEASEEQERLAQMEEQERISQQMSEEQVSQQEQGQPERTSPSSQREEQEQEQLAQEQQQEQEKMSEQQEKMSEQQERFAEQQEQTPQEQERSAQRMSEEQHSALDPTLPGNCPDISEANVSAQAAPSPLPNVPGKFYFYCYDFFFKKKKNQLLLQTLLALLAHLVHLSHLVLHLLRSTHLRRHHRPSSMTKRFILHPECW